MAGNSFPPSSFKSSESPPPVPLNVHWKPEDQLVTQISESELQVNPEPVQPEGQLESRGDSQVTSARSSSVAPLLSASIGPGERSPQEGSPSPPELSPPSPPLLSPPLLSPLSFQMGFPETKILVERYLSVFVCTDLDYLGKPRPEVGESSVEGSLADRPQSDPLHPEARSGIPAIAGPRASGSAGFSDLDITIPQSAGKPKTMPTTIWQSREISETLEKATNIFFGVVKVPNPSAVPVSKINLNCLPILYHEAYNVKLINDAKFKDPSMLSDKLTRIYKMLEELLFKKHLCGHIKVEATDIRKYAFLESSPVTPDSVKKLKIFETAEILKVNFHTLECPNWLAFDTALLYPLRVQVNGSLQACIVALKLGWAINLGGGFCYNSLTYSKGLAVYDDLLHCLINLSFPRTLMGEEVRHILVINCDAYQSSSYRHIEAIKCRVTIFDFFFSGMPSSEKPPSQHQNRQVDYRPFKIDEVGGEDIATHLRKAHEMIEMFLMEEQTLPSLCIYIAGTNVMYEHDESSSVKFKEDDVIQRDLGVFNIMQEKGIPIVILLGGGNRESDAEAAAHSIIEICKSGWMKLNTKWLADQAQQPLQPPAQHPMEPRP